MMNRHKFVPCPDTLSCPEKYHKLCHSFEEENIECDLIEEDEIHIRDYELLGTR